MVRRDRGVSAEAIRADALTLRLHPIVSLGLDKSVDVDEDRSGEIGARDDQDSRCLVAGESSR